MTRIILSAFLLPLILATPAYAYLDPGVGSMVLQAMAAAVVAVSIFWNKICRIVKAPFKKSAGGKASETEK